jgi:hypothetical protein
MLVARMVVTAVSMMLTGWVLLRLDCTFEYNWGFYYTSQHLDWWCVATLLQRYCR